VIKKRTENSTASEIHLLTENSRVEEIARMMGTVEMTAQAKAHAKQLLKKKELVD
jgi:DNA repair protein RecN (Recombination protein N)